MKKTLLSIALFTIIVSLVSCGGGGPGSSGVPQGVNPGIPSVVQLLDVQNIVQTNSSVYFKAKVLDGNGNPVRNEPVTFINLSSIGTWQSPVTKTDISLSSVTTLSSTVIKNTDSLGFATNRLFSPVPGFATVQAEVNTGTGQVRDQRTVYFTSSATLNLQPTLTLGVDGTDADSIFNETEDFLLFENAADNEVTVRATVLSGIGLPVFNSTVTFGADVPYRVGDPDATCSDGTDTCEVFFPMGNTAITTSPLGQAFVLVQVNPTFLRTITTTLNITAVADNGAFNLVTLFLNPVNVTTVTVSANPPIVASEGTSTITAFVLTSAGTPVPDGTSVNFTATAGGIEPFAQTTDGIAEVTFTAPTVAADTTVTITATVAGVSGTTTVTVTAELADLRIQPTTFPISGAAGGTATFTIFGGTAGYSVFLDDPLLTPVPAIVAASGDSFIVTVLAGTCPHDVEVTVFDSVGDSVTATIEITVPTPLSVFPPSDSICEDTAGCIAGKDSQTYQITGGVPLSSGPPNYNVTSDAQGSVPDASIIPDGSDQFTVNPINGVISADTTVTIDITDACATTVQLPILIIDE